MLLVSLCLLKRNKTGLWGWRSDKTEMINGRDCKVFSATNVELVTKTRTEHLSAEDKSQVAAAAASQSRFPLNSLLAVGGGQQPESESSQLDEAV